MTTRLACSLSVALLACTGFLGCSDDPDKEPPSTDEGPDGAVPPAEGGPEAGPSVNVDPFNGDCTTARWANVSDSCWSCMCETCADTLDLCEAGCIELMECALDKDTLVGNAPDIQCEVRATRDLCLPGNDETVWGQAAAFDGCLILSPKTTGFRICEAECGIQYSGDVCERYPEPDAGADGG